MNYRHGVPAPLNMPGWTKLLLLCQIPHTGLKPFTGFINIGKSAGKGVSKQVPHVATQEFSANLFMASSFTFHFQEQKGEVK